MEITTSPPFTGGAFLTPICGPDGSAALPTYSFCSDLNTGIYLSAADSLSLTTAGTQRLIVDPSGKIGIGISAPSTLLHISSNGTTTLSSATAELMLSGADPQLILDETDGSADNKLWDFLVSSEKFLGRLVNDANSIASNWVEVDRTGTVVDQVVFPAGKVGIGISSPDGTLHAHTASAGAVTANTGADDLVVENSVAGGISILTPDASSSNLYFGSPTDTTGALIRWNHDAGLMTLGTNRVSAGAEISVTSGNGIEAIRIDSSQDVGIGTTAPGARLTIEGPTGDVHIRTQDGTYTSTQIGTFGTNEGVARLYYQGTENTRLASNSLSFIKNTLTVGDSVIEASAVLETTSTTRGFLPPRMNTTQRDAISTPATGLQIFNTTTSSTQEYTGAIWQNIGASGTADPLLLGSGTAGAPTYSFSADATTGVYYHGSNALAFTANGTRAMVIDSTQNVGIGISTPDGRLHVHSATAGVVSAPASASNLVIEDSGNMGMTLLCPDLNTSTIVFGTVTDNLGADINWDYTNSLYSIRTAKAGASLRFATANGTEAMRIDSTQNVGIGITAPDGRLHVHTATAGVVTANGEADDLIIENSAASGLSILSPASSSSSIFLGNVNNSSEGRIKYISGASSNTGRMEIWAGGATAVDIGNDLHVDIKDSLSVNTPTGGDKGVGTLNAKAIYDDGNQVSPFNAYRATLGSTQSISTGAASKVTLDTETFDTNSDYDPTTSYRFTPTIAGKYSITAGLQFINTLEDLKSARVHIYKNGSLYSSGEVGTSGTSSFIVSVTDLVDMNGSTDYIEVFCNHSFTTSETINTTSFVAGHMVAI